MTDLNQLLLDFIFQDQDDFDYNLYAELFRDSQSLQFTNGLLSEFFNRWQSCADNVLQRQIELEEVVDQIDSQISVLKEEVISRNRECDRIFLETKQTRSEIDSIETQNIQIGSPQIDATQLEDQIKSLDEGIYICQSKLESEMELNKLILSQIKSSELEIKEKLELRQQVQDCQNQEITQRLEQHSQKVQLLHAKQSTQNRKLTQYLNYISDLEKLSQETPSRHKKMKSQPHKLKSCRDFKISNFDDVQQISEHISQDLSYMDDQRKRQTSLFTDQNDETLSQITLRSYLHDSPKIDYKNCHQTTFKQIQQHFQVLGHRESDNGSVSSKQQSVFVSLMDELQMISEEEPKRQTKMLKQSEPDENFKRYTPFSSYSTAVTSNLSSDAEIEDYEEISIESPKETLLRKGIVFIKNFFSRG